MMKIKLLMMIAFIVNNSVALYSSDDEWSEPGEIPFALEDSPDVRLRRPSAQAILNTEIENKRVRIGTISTLHTVIDQLATSDNEYHKDVAFGSFFQKYPHVIDQIKQDSVAFDALGRMRSNGVFDIMKRRAERGMNSSTDKFRVGKIDEIEYRLIGEIPFCDDDGDRDLLFDLTSSRRRAILAVKTYINNHEVDVRKKCVGPGLSSVTSQAVWATQCCKTQLHRSCFRQCKKNEIGHCINSFCQRADDGKPYSLNWTPEFYKSMQKKNPLVIPSKIRDVACPICYEPLKNNDETIARSNGVKRRSDAIDEDDIALRAAELSYSEITNFRAVQQFTSRKRK